MNGRSGKEGKVEEKGEEREKIDDLPRRVSGEETLNHVKKCDEKRGE